jgi:hypothetical protein
MASRTWLSVANAPDPKESFSHAPAKTRRKNVILAKKQNSSIAKSLEPLQKRDDTSVYSISPPFQDSST